MCGIAGYAGRDDPGLLRRMAGRMVHRGPDDEGFWSDSTERVGLAHRALFILGTSGGGHQPMTTGNGQVQISFNGEIYNFLDHRRRLETKGVRFRGHSDTEVLLHLYLEKGLDALQELDGMFAVAIWDGRCRRLLLARDHAGVKPLYYWVDRESLLFASEIKALLEDPEVPN